MKVLISSRHFPKSHLRAGEKTEFVRKILAGEKIHTIRANAKGYFKDGEMVSLRYWSGRPRCSKQVEFAFGKIWIEPIRLVFASDGISAFAGEERIDVALLTHGDGLSIPDFRAWFFPDGKYGEFRGDILHFTDFRYAGG
jgi:hypothetical protein